jgi:hypothetical protein
MGSLRANVYTASCGKGLRKEGLFRFAQFAGDVSGDKERGDAGDCAKV